MVSDVSDRRYIGANRRRDKEMTADRSAPIIGAKRGDVVASHRSA
jgi:hypothetical protein